MVEAIPGKTHRRKRDARKRAVTIHRDRVTAKLAKRGFLKDLVATLEWKEDRDWTEETHQSLLEAKANLRATECQLRAFGDVDIPECRRL